MFTEKVGRLLLDLHFTRTFKKSSKSGDFAERGSGDFAERGMDCIIISMRIQKI
jgi:hypothetical protein